MVDNNIQNYDGDFDYPILHQAETQHQDYHYTEGIQNTQKLADDVQEDHHQTKQNISVKYSKFCEYFSLNITQLIKSVDKQKIYKNKLNIFLFLISMIVFIAMISQIQLQMNKTIKQNSLQPFKYQEQHQMKKRTNQIIKFKKQHYQQINRKKNYKKNLQIINQFKEIFSQAINSIKLKDSNYQNYLINKTNLINIQRNISNQNKLDNINYQNINKQNNTIHSYQNFQRKLEKVSNLAKQKLYQMKLQPLMMNDYTTPRKKKNILDQFFNKVQSIYKGINNIDYLLLKQMLTSGGYWHSIGQKLTVNAVDQENLSGKKNIQLIMPVLFQMIFPYDFPQNQSIKVWGIAIDSTLIATKSRSHRFLGQFYIQITSQQRKNRLPIKRIFYCEEFDCAAFYGYIIFQTKHEFMIHQLKIYSTDIIMES